MNERDVSYEADDTYDYECLRCSETVSATGHPGDCPDCGAAMRNRRMPYE